MGWLNRNRDFPGLWKPATPLDAQWQLHHRLWRDELPRKRSTGGRIPEVPAAQWGSQWHWWFNCVMVWMWWNVPHLKLTQPLNDIATSKKSLNCRAQLTSFSMLFSNLHCLQVINVENRGKSSTFGPVQINPCHSPNISQAERHPVDERPNASPKIHPRPWFHAFQIVCDSFLSRISEEVRSFLRRILVKKPSLVSQWWYPYSLSMVLSNILSICYPYFQPNDAQTCCRNFPPSLWGSPRPAAWSRSLVDDSIESPRNPSKSHVRVEKHIHFLLVFGTHPASVPCFPVYTSVLM